MRLSIRLTEKLPWAVVLAGTLFILAGFTCGQSSETPSLGDLARKQRQKQQAKGTSEKPKKVVTNEDIPDHPAPPPASHDGKPKHCQEPSVAPAQDVARTGDQWKEAIQQQKDAIADLKGQIEELQSSIHFVLANAYHNGVQYNQEQAQKQQEVERMQGQLSNLRQKLEQMQESARRAGFGSAVWDP